jgi:hypothetical protein
MTLPGVTYRPLTADFLTHSYRVVGKVLMPNAGLLRQINDATPPYVDVQEAQLARLYMPNKLVEKFDLIRLVKNQITAVCLLRRDDIRLRSDLAHQAQQWSEYTFRATTAVYEISGILPWLGHFDLGELLERTGQDFFPLFNARIQASLVPSVMIDCPAAIINRRQLDLVTLAQPIAP